MSSESKIKKLHRNRNLNLGASNLSESKINQLALHLECLFEHGVNFRNRVITLTGEINDVMFSRFEGAMTELEAQSKKTITIRINSPGGDVYSALAIVGRMNRSHCKIVTEGYGAIMSAATLILAAGNERKVSRFAWTMFHEASYQIAGRHSEVKAFVKQNEREDQAWATWMSEFSNKKDIKFWKETGKLIDEYFTPEQLISLGVVDEIF